MSTFLQRPPRCGAAKLRAQAASSRQSISLPNAGKPVVSGRVETKPASAAVLRPINLERRARFARMETDAPRGA
jgi:hypothetical protein